MPIYQQASLRARGLGDVAWPGLFAHSQRLESRPAHADLPAGNCEATDKTVKITVCNFIQQSSRATTCRSVRRQTLIDSREIETNKRGVRWQIAHTQEKGIYLESRVTSFFLPTAELLEAKAGV